MPILPLSLRHAFRQLLRAPGFTITVVLTLALGIGATTSIFTFVHGVLLRPLPYPEPERMVSVCEVNLEQPGGWCGGSPANWADWARRSRTLENVGLARSWMFSLKQPEKMLMVQGGIATPGLFQSFRVQPALGRVFEPRDIEPGSQHVLLLSHAFWQGTFGGATDIVGRRVVMDGESYEIIGVLPPGFAVPSLETTEAWIPLWPERRSFRGWRGFHGYGRLRAGVTPAQAQAEMAGVRAQLAEEHPDTNKGWDIRVTPLRDNITGEVRPALLLFLAAVACVLLIACANVANLFLARSAGREREFAMRLALGATRGRLAGQILLEHALYAGLGGIAGVLLSFWMVDLFRVLAPGWMPRLEEVHFSWPVLGFAAGVTIVTALLFGIAPALHSSDLKLSEALHEGRTVATSRRGRRLREILVVSEIALACLLLVGGGLLLRSFAGLLDWQPGFDRENLVIAQVFSSRGKYPKRDMLPDVVRRASEELAALPSVLAVGAGSAGPLFGGDGESEFTIEGRPVPGAGEKPMVAWYDTDPNYFRALGIPLLRGRYFNQSDRIGAPQVAIINQAMAERFWPGADPIGQRVHMVAHDMTLEIVGVVGNVQPFRSDRRPQPEIYWPFAQSPRWAIAFFVRTSTPAETMLATVRTRLEQFDPGTSVMNVTTMDRQIQRRLTDPRFHLTLTGIFAGLATLIAMVGIYGVMSLSVAQRSHELGVRLALGAAPRDILRLVLGKGMALAAIGLAAGLAGALALGRLLQGFLVGVSAADPLTFAGIALLVALVTLAACYLPARRATRTDPLAALRCE